MKILSFKIKGFSVNLKPSFFVMCALLTAAGCGRLLCVLIFSVTLHEAGHICAAMLCGIRPEGILITPIGQQAYINGIERISFFRRMVIVLAGPSVNIALYLIFGSRINMALFLFNMLPAYPLDGGRFLHYILGYCLGVLRANRVQSFLSKGIAVALFVLGFVQTILYFGNISLLCIGFYLIKINRQEYINMTFAFYRSVMYRSDKKVLSVRGIMAGEGIFLKTIVYRLGWDYYTIVYVRSGNKSICIGEEELIAYIMRENINHRLKDIVKSGYNYSSCNCGGNDI